ncbi:hypothetical protein LMG24235_08477 [Paraburkholderia sabiae]|nr:hypothetical protein LMG24235_08477 [Paraburkholderia sabiae]
MLNTPDHTLEALARRDVKGFLSTQPEPVVDRFVAAPVGQMRCALEATAILFDRKDALHDAFFASHFGATGGRYPRHHFPTPVALLNAILDDLGYGLVPAMQAEPLIGSGRAGRTRVSE